MADEFETVWRAGTRQFADATRLPAAEVIRARGDQRRRRMVALVATLAVMVIVGGAWIAAAGAVATDNAPVSHGTDLSLRLIAPGKAGYAPDVPNPVSLVIRNPGKARMAWVRLDLGQQKYQVERKASVERFDVRAGRWLAVALVHSQDGWQASYPLRISSGVTRQRLFIVPAVPVAHPATYPGPRMPTPKATVEQLRVSITAGGHLLAVREARTTVLAWMVGQLSEPKLSRVARGHSHVLVYTVSNPAAVGYPVRFSLYAEFFCQPPRPRCGGASGLPAGDLIEWLDGSTWRAFRPSAYRMEGVNGELLMTAPLPAGGSHSIRIRLLAGAHVVPVSGQIYFLIQPDLLRFPGPVALYAVHGYDSWQVGTVATWNIHLG
jgi:hypothetical protein